MTEHAYGPECLNQERKHVYMRILRWIMVRKKNVKAMKLFVKVKWLHERRNTV